MSVNFIVFLLSLIAGMCIAAAVMLPISIWLAALLAVAAVGIFMLAMTIKAWDSAQEPIHQTTAPDSWL